MLTVDEIEAIRRAFYVEQQSIRAIAREQRQHRRVVREAIAGASPPRQYRFRQPKAKPALDPVRERIDGWLEGDATAPRKQRHTAKRICDRWAAEVGFTGSERIIRQSVGQWKRSHGAAPLGSVPLADAPGAEAQCDWGEAVVEGDGAEQLAQLCCLRRCSSLQPFVCAFPATKQECVLAGHAAAFAAFGAVPQRITDDNLTTAVRRVLEGRNRLEQDACVAFRGHSLFRTHCCLPGKEGAHEKPMVESLVGDARRNFLVPPPKVASWAARNAHLAARCAAEDARTVERRPASSGAMWQEERAAMLPLQHHDHSCCRTLAVTANRLGMVTFERHHSSVCSRYGGQQLLLRAFAWHVESSDGQTLLVRHPRLYGRDGEQLDPQQYLELLERKPGAVALARPIQQWAKTWPPICRQYLDALRQARPEGATREFVRILQLQLRATTEALAAALEQALALDCWSADSVEQLLRPAQQPKASPTVVDLAATPTLAPLADSVIPLPDLQSDAPLLAEAEAGARCPHRLPRRCCWTSTCAGCACRWSSPSSPRSPKRRRSRASPTTPSCCCWWHKSWRSATSIRSAVGSPAPSSRLSRRWISTTSPWRPSSTGSWRWNWPRAATWPSRRICSWRAPSARGKRTSRPRSGRVPRATRSLWVPSGVAACRQGRRVRFSTAAGLTNELLEAQANHRLQRYERSLLGLTLLILDEVGVVPFTKLGADLLFSFLAAVHEQVSLIVTTTVPFAEWTSLFGGDQRLTAALLDRGAPAGPFHAHVLQCSGQSYRLRQSLKRQEEDRRPHGGKLARRNTSKTLESIW